MKRSLSLFLVLCMLLAAVPALVLPVLAEDDVTVLEAHRFIEEFPGQVTYTVSENKHNAPIGREPFADDEAYKEWLLSEGVFAINQGTGNWKVGEFNATTAELDLFARIAFYAGDNATGHDMNWAMTESAYQKLAAEYVKEPTKGGVIWGGYSLWHTFMGNVWRQDNGLATSTNALQYGRLTNSDSTHLSAIQYTIPTDGAWGMQVGNVSESAANGHAIAIFVNEKLVWPTNANASDMASWYPFTKSTTTATLNTNLRPLAMNLKAGDKVSFVTGKTGDAMYWEPIMQKLDAVPLYLSLSDPYGSNSQNIRVSAGQQVTLPTYQGDLVFFGWDADGDGIADYTDGATITIGETALSLTAVVLKPSKFMEQLPYWDTKNEVVVNPGDWTFGAWEKATGAYLPAQYCSAPFVATTSGGPWGGGPAMYDTSRTGIVVASNTLTYGSGYTCDKEEGPYIASLQYTAAYNGKLTLNFDELTIKRELNQNEEPVAAPIIGGMAIYLEGEKVWPTDGEYYWFDSSKVMADAENQGIFSGYSEGCDFLRLMEKAGNWPFPLTLEGVEMGDNLDIRIVRGTPYNWYFDIRPTVTYAELDETPTISATSVDLAENFDLNIYANVLSKADDSVVKMEYWLTKPSEIALQNGGKALELTAEENGLYKFTYKGLTAKQMTDVIYVRPYTENANGGAYGAVQAVSIRDYALAAMGRNEKLDNLLVAMLNYGSDAQTLFGYKDDDRANASLNDAQKGMMPDQDKINNVYAQGEGATPIRSASLILGNSIGMKYTVALVEGATTYELEVSKNADFSNSTKLAMTATNEGDEMKAIYDVKLGEMKDTFYVRVVVDGTAGAALTYSVDSYITRINESSSDDATWHMTMTLAYLEQMLATYLA